MRITETPVSVEITSAANSQVEKIMGGITKRSGSKSLSDPLMISRFEELRVCMLTYCGNNSRISIAANAGANRFSVIRNLWDDVTSLDLTVKPKLTQRLLFAAATGNFDLCNEGKESWVRINAVGP